VAKARLADHTGFAALRHRYAASLPAKVRAIEAAAAALERAPRDTPRARTLFLHVHRLAGSSALYGFTRVSAAASQFEKWLSSAAPAPEIVPPDDLSPLPGHVRSLRESLTPGAAS
jgi:HPt (histidine-containing phosphotransfer) domain-containing protein